MKNILIILFVLTKLSGFGQTKVIILTKENLKKAQTFPKNHSLTILCDSGVVVFEKTRYDEFSKLTRENIKHLESLAANNDSIAQLNLKALADVTAITKALIQNVNTSVDSASVILISTRENLSGTINNLNAANANLKETQAILEREKKEKWKKLVSWGAGGFLVGVLGTVIIFTSN
ncbi:hypothetical protein CNR22_01845 [Sphingobacteriaceae bacterium]|nr:hypothetical protein CNR22_01845 [Sphingobacteriaceae bacterium]